MKIVFALLLILGCTALPVAGIARSSGPVPVEELVAQPLQKLTHVLVSGQIDNCFSFNCQLCPEDMARETFNSQKCLALSFDGYEDLLHRANISHLMDSAFRFATVELDADYDPTCLLGKEPEAHNGMMSIVVCTDRASVIVNARIKRVFSRKTAADGLIGGYDEGALTEPSASEKAEMQNALRPIIPDRESAAIKIFLIPKYTSYDETVSLYGLGCICRRDACTDSWPDRFFMGFDSPANPYSCTLLGRRKNSWDIVYDSVP